MYVCMWLANSSLAVMAHQTGALPQLLARTVNKPHSTFRSSFKLQATASASFKRSNFKQASSVQTSSHGLSKLQSVGGSARWKGGGRDLAITLTLPLTLTVALILDLTLDPTLALNHTVTHTLSHTLTTALALTLTHVGREAVVEADQLRRDASIGQASICRC